MYSEETKQNNDLSPRTIHDPVAGVRDPNQLSETERNNLTDYLANLPFELRAEVEGQLGSPENNPHFEQHITGLLNYINAVERDPEAVINPPPGISAATCDKIRKNAAEKKELVPNMMAGIVGGVATVAAATTVAGTTATVGGATVISDDVNRSGREYTMGNTAALEWLTRHGGVRPDMTPGARRTQELGRI